MQSIPSAVGRTSSAESRITPRRYPLTTTQIIEVTDLAAEKLEEVLNEQGEDGALLRVMVMPGEQGGFQYMLGVEKDAKDDDIMIDAGNIRVLVDPESAPMVEGAKIDYMDGLMRSGFVISNPNLQGEGGGCGGGGGCACGGGGGGGGCGGGGGGCACGGH